MLNYRSMSEVWFDAAEQLLRPPRGVTLPWWPKTTDFLGGLRAHELTLLCAPTGAGKTQLLANLAAQLLIQDDPIFVAPVETGDTDFMVRVVSAWEGEDLNTGVAVSPERLSALTAKYQKLLGKRLLISTYDNRVAIEDMVLKLTYMHQHYGVTVAILDNLNFFLKVVSSQMEKAEMDSAIHELVMLVKRLPMHVILVVHPRKTEGGRVISEFDIKGSSTAVQECANVCLFNRAEPKDIEGGKHTLSDREMVFRKIRKRGFNVGKPIWFQYRSGRYEEVR